MRNVGNIKFFNVLKVKPKEKRQICLVSETCSSCASCDFHSHMADSTQGKCMEFFCTVSQHIRLFTPFLSLRLCLMTSLVLIFSWKPSFLLPLTWTLTPFSSTPPISHWPTNPPPPDYFPFTFLIPTHSLVSLGALQKKKKKSSPFYQHKLKFGLSLFHYLSCPPFMSGVILSHPQRHCFT